MTAEPNGKGRWKEAVDEANKSETRLLRACGSAQKIIEFNRQAVAQEALEASKSRQ